MTINLHDYSKNLSRDTNCYAQVSSNQLSSTKQNMVEIDRTLDVVIFGSLASLALFYLIWRLCFQKASGRLPKFFQSSTQINCTKCRFFNNNSYLKCAVHPSSVLKKEAQKCLDYKPRTKRRTNLQVKDI